MAVAMLLALAITVFVLYTIVSRALAPTETTVNPYAGVSGTVATLTTSTTGGSGTGTTDGGNTGGAILVRPHAATASSSLKATTITDFRPTNLLDGDLATAWNEGADGTGVGEWVRFEFDGVIPLTRIEIANGYQKDAERFSGNVRVKSLELRVLRRHHSGGPIARHPGSAGDQAEGAKRHGVDQADHPVRLSDIQVAGRGSVRGSGLRDYWQ